MTASVARRSDGVEEKAAALRLGLVSELAGRGLLADRRWRRAVAEVPRHRFVQG